MIKSAVIFLHGSDQVGTELQAYLSVASLTEYNHNSFIEVLNHLDWKIYTPTAPSRQYAACNKATRYVWQDKNPIEDKQNVHSDNYEDILGINSNLKKIVQIVSEICTSFTNIESIFIGGFENGGSFALHLLRKYFDYDSNLDHLHKIKGLFMMSHYLIPESIVYKCLQNNRNNYSNSINSTNKSAYIVLPEILIFQTAQDECIPSEWMKHTATSLLLYGLEVTLKTYGMIFICSIWIMSYVYICV